VTVTTKSFLVTRDLDLLARLAAERLVGVALTIPFADEAMARLMERGTEPAKRFEAIERLSQAGVPVEVLVAPIIQA